MIENEKTHSAKYQVLCNRLTNGTPFTTDTAQARITALADTLEAIRATIPPNMTCLPHMAGDDPCIGEGWLWFYAKRRKWAASADFKFRPHSSLKPEEHRTA